MTEVEVNRERVGSLIEEYQDHYREVPVERDPIAVPAEAFDDYVASARTGYDGGAYAWVVRDAGDVAPLSDTAAVEFDDRRRVLMHYPRSGDEWGLPGGGREDEESFEEAAVREVREETGIDCEITGLWLLRRHVWESADPGDDRRTHSLHVFFDARYTGGHIEIQPGEVNGAAWFATLPERMADANERRAEPWDPDPDPDPDSGAAGDRS